MTEDYWEGGTWVYHASITNDAMDTANHTYTIVPGAGNELEILQILAFNGDTSSRNVTVLFGDGSNTIGGLSTASVGVSAGARALFPMNLSSTTGGIGAPSRFIISGTMEVIVTLASIAVSQDTEVAFICRIRGGLPTVTEAASAGVPVISINTEQVF